MTGTHVSFLVNSRPDPIAMDTRAKPQGHLDPRNGALIEIPRLGDVDLGLVLVVPVDDV